MSRMVNTNTTAEKKLAEIIAAHDCGVQNFHDLGCIGAVAREFAVWALGQAANMTEDAKCLLHHDYCAAEDTAKKIQAVAREIGGND